MNKHFESKVDTMIQLSATFMCVRTAIMIKIMCVRLNLEDDCMAIKFQMTVCLRIFFDLMKHCYQFLGLMIQ